MAPGRKNAGTRSPTISQPLLRWFRWLVRRNFRRSFHAVRLHEAVEIGSGRGPYIVYANHSGWWDPMVAFQLGAALMPDRRHYAPMDASSLQRYRILARLGVFPVELQSARGAVQFLRTGEAVLREGGVLWVTPQGKFADVRERPLDFKPGLASLAARVPGCTVLPLAIEYVFWDERTPEALLLLGEPVRVGEGETAASLEPRLKVALETAMTQLQELAMAREASGFERVLVRGRVGVGGFYDLGKRIKAWLTRTTHQPEHRLPAAVSTEESGRSTHV